MLIRFFTWPITETIVIVEIVGLFGAPGQVLFKLARHESTIQRPLFATCRTPSLLPFAGTDGGLRQALHPIEPGVYNGDAGSEMNLNSSSPMCARTTVHTV